MKKTIFLLVLNFILVSSAVAWRSGEMEVKVFLNTPEHHEMLYKLKLNGDVYKDFARMYVIPEEMDKIKQTSLQYEIIIPDLEAHSNHLQNLRTEWLTYNDIIALMDSCATNFPNICRKEYLGESVQGREISVCIISDNVMFEENEPEVMFDGGIHGDELCSQENTARMIRYLCLNYGNDPTVTDLVNNREIWLYPQVNPDGRVMMQRYNANGVDLNRDWGYMWDAWGGSPGAYSQPETKLLRSCMYNNQFVVHTTYHGGTEYISYPWSYRASQCPDYAHIDQLAGVYASVSGYTNLDYGQGCTGMYPINGSSKDTNYGVMGSISWSMEISYQKQPPTSQIMYYWTINIPSMLAMMEYSGYGIEGLVTDAVTGDAVAAIVWVNDYMPTYTDPQVGDFHKYVLPGSYTVTISANGYESQTVNNVIVTANNATTVDFHLQPIRDNVFYGYKFSASQIPDNNTGDEGNTPASLGAPDNINYSIGVDGWCIIDMQYPVVDGPFNDFTVYEGDTSEEGYDCFVSNSIDGPFYLVGTGLGTTEFDISNSGLAEAQFIKIVDDGDGSSSAPDAGFDLDAISTEFIQGPNLVIDDYYIDDSASGNNDGVLDPGEEADLYISIRNNGTETAEDILAFLGCSDPFITINGTLGPFDDLEPDEIGTSSIVIQAVANTPDGHSVLFSLDLSCNNYTFSADYSFSIYIGSFPFEGFETGDFTSYDWQFGGNGNWTIDATNAYEGAYCAKSGNISHQQTTELSVTMDVTDGMISFYRKVSSESSYDFLEFYIDGSMQGQWSGEMNWAEVSYNVSSGIHTFTWVYDKDYTISGGQDCAWIDNIFFPAPVPTYPILYLAPMSIDFGECVVGNELIEQFEIKNVGGGTLAGEISTPDGYMVQETGTSNPVSQLSYSLIAGEVQSYELIFCPDNVQNYDDQVTVSVFPLQTEFINVYGEGIPSAAIGSQEFYTETKLIGTFPNPVKNQANIAYQLKGSSQMQNIDIKIYDISGKFVTTVHGENGHAVIDCSKLGNGIYLYKIHHDGVEHIKKMVIVHE